MKINKLIGGAKGIFVSFAAVIMLLIVGCASKKEENPKPSGPDSKVFISPSAAKPWVLSKMEVKTGSSFVNADLKYSSILYYTNFVVKADGSIEIEEPDFNTATWKLEGDKLTLKVSGVSKPFVHTIEKLDNSTLVLVSSESLEYQDNTGAVKTYAGSRQTFKR